MAIVARTMAALLSRELRHKAAALRAGLAAALRAFGRLIYSSSLGAEATLLTHVIWSTVALPA